MNRQAEPGRRSDSFPRFHHRWLSWAFFLAVLVVPGPARGSGELDRLYTHGPGPVEVYIMTDYFCPPCQGIEPYLERALPEMLRQGVKISFVDTPIHLNTPLYSRYYIFAAAASNTFEQAMKVRNALFDVARTKSIVTDQELIQELKARDIKIKLTDTTPIFNQWRELIARFKVESTPTCVVVKPGEKDKVYAGGKEIRKGLDQFRRELSPAGVK
ncbi:MAG: hypothetical protein V1816_21390 [Pseudomonadota bacterium]